jgi:hypothetical protein
MGRLTYIDANLIRVCTCACEACEAGPWLTIAMENELMKRVYRWCAN